MLVGHRSLPLPSTFRPSPARVCRPRMPGGPQQAAPAARRVIPARSLHQPSHEPDESPLEKIERHFDDRDRMYPAADLLRLVAHHKSDPGCRQAVAWMLRVETALEFLAELEIEAGDADTPRERQRALRDALANARGIRQLLDTFDAFLLDDPEIFEATLIAADAAFGRRIAELERLCGNIPRPATPADVFESEAPAGIRGRLTRFWRRLRNGADAQVQWREQTPRIDYEPLNFLRRHIEKNYDPDGDNSDR